MATTSSTALLLLFLLSLSPMPVPGHAFEYELSWVVPRSADDEMYNEWASKHRFQVGDTITFKYETDSVLMVVEDDYEDCNAEKPIFFSNNGKSEVTLDRPGMFYFISGVSGHCKRGQKMIIKVLGHSMPPDASPSNGTTNGTDTNGATPTTATGVFSVGMFGLSIVYALVQVVGFF